MPKKTAFKTLSILVSQQIDPQDPILSNVKDYLLSRGCTVYLESWLAQPSHSLVKNCDLMIVIGGDGSLLRAARLVVDHGIPILGINQGHLGFLADIQPQFFRKQLGAILDGQYQETHRFLLEVEILSDTQSIHEIALNEIVLVSGDIARMIEYQLTLDGQLVCTQRADGLIIATPTGSTAYALSGGGPILHPQLDAFVLVPMFPHTLSARPLVVSANSTLELKVAAPRARNLPGLTCDGLQQILLSPQAKITIRKKAKSLRLIHPPEYQYFEVLRSKLQWQST